MDIGTKFKFNLSSTIFWILARKFKFKLSSVAFSSFPFGAKIQIQTFYDIFSSPRLDAQRSVVDWPLVGRLFADRRRPFVALVGTVRLSRAQRGEKGARNRF